MNNNASIENEILASEILESISEGFFALDNSMNIMYFNKASEALLGRKRKEVIGKNLFEAFPEAAGSIFESKYRRAIEKKEFCSFEIFFEEEPYSNWYNVKVYPFGSGISVFFHVTTELKREEEEQRRIAQRLRTIIENMPVMLIAFDEDAIIIAWNRECEHITGFTANEILYHQGAMELLFPDREYRRKIIDKMIGSGDMFRSVEWNIRCKDGSEKIIAWSSLSEQFPVLGWQSWVVGTDVTGLRRIEGDLNDLLAEKDRLLKEVYHRVKNNIAMIISLVSLQQTINEDNEKLEDILNNLQNKLKAIGLVHEHLYSTDSVSKINVKQYLEELIENIEETTGIESGRVVIESDIDHILIDADFVISLGMIVTELITNAGKYAFPAGRRGRIRVVFKGEDTDLMLSVSDDGIGIKEADAPSNPKSLGLSIVRAGVRRYGGTVNISNKNGTQVEIRIPKNEVLHKS